MENQPLVSVVTPAFNAARFIKDTIDSVLAQTYKNWEMLICDDGSSDDTVEIVSMIARDDARIKVILSEKNGGPAVARNKALEMAAGRFIAFLDADDLWLPAKLEKQVNFMLVRDYAITYMPYSRIDEKGRLLGSPISVPNKTTYRQLLKHNVLGCLTVVVDRSKCGELKMLSQGYDDYILWLSILRKGFVAHALQENCSRYRILAGSVSRNRLRAAQWVWNIYRNIEGLNLFDCIWNFLNYFVRVSFKNRHLYLHSPKAKVLS